MARLETDIGKMSDLITKGIQGELEKIIKERLKQNIDGLLSEIARDLARQTLVNVQSILAMEEPFGPTAKVMLSFNNKLVDYLPESKMVKDDNGTTRLDDGLDPYRRGGGRGGPAKFGEYNGQ